MNKELKPCPFCGSDALAGQCRERGFYVGCVSQDCEASVDHFNGPGAATEAWNTRAPSDGASRPDGVTECDIAEAMIRCDFAGKPDSEGNMEHFTRFVSASTRRAMAEYLSGLCPAPSPTPITGDSDKSDLPIANSVQLSEEMVERVVAEFVDPIKDSFDRTGYDDGAEYAALEIKDRLIALLREQGQREWISVEAGMAPLPPGTVALHESWLNGWRVDVFVWGERSTWTKGDRRYCILFDKMPTPPPFPESNQD